MSASSKIPRAANEAERLASLRSYQVLDTAEEESFDELARLATIICGTPIGLIVLVDEKRQWFKSHIGIEERETPIELSFCTHTIMGDALMVVEDARSDERFRDNPLVSGDPYVTFYAGVPLINEDGYALGTLCVVDQKVRRLEAEQARALGIIARQVVDKLEKKKRAAEALEAARSIAVQRNRLENMIESSPIAITVLLGKDLLIDMANDPMLRIWNRTREQTIGRKLLDVFPELVGQPFPDLLNKVLSTGESVSIPEIEAMIESESGSNRHYVDFKYSPMFDTEGGVEGVMASVIDITDRVNARKSLEESHQAQQTLNEELAASNEELAAINEELVTSVEDLDRTGRELENTLNKLAESESKARLLITEAPVAIGLLAGRNMVIETANTMMLDVWGKSEVIIGQPLHVALPELVGQPYLQLLDDVFTSGRKFYGEDASVFLERGGVLQECFFNFVYQPLKDHQGTTTSILVVVSEITAQYIAHKRLEQAEAKLRLATEAAAMGTWYLNAETREFIPSGRLKELFGFSADKPMSYEEAAKQVPEEYRDNILSAVEEVISTGGSFDVEFPFVSAKDEQLRWVRASGKLFADEPGEPAHFSGAMIEITEQKKDEQRKNDFIAIVSHELKTPLTSLSAYIQVLAKRAQNYDDKFLSEGLEKAMSQSRKMSSMINGFLNVSRLEAGKIHLEPAVFSLNELIDETVSDVTVSSPGCDIVTEAAAKIEVRADRDKIGHVITNLLSNAVKYSERGSRIDIRLEKHGGVAKLSIRDRGIGIRPEDIDSLFDRYYRVDNQNTKHISGFGIGLYLSAEIIRRHHGKIGVTSEAGLGSTFYFELPLS